MTDYPESGCDRYCSRHSDARQADG